jgi:predicted DNA binding CopG/RHH family protein
MNNSRSPYMKSYFKNNKYYISNKNKINNFKNKLLKDNEPNAEEKLLKFIYNLLSKEKFVPTEFKYFRKEHKKIEIRFD